MVELGSVIIVGCCPSIPRIVRRHQTRMGSGSSGYTETWGNSAARLTAKPRPDTLEEHEGFARHLSDSEETLEMNRYGNHVEWGCTENVSVGDGVVNTTGILQMPAPVHDVGRAEKPAGWI